jgi:hypothetical protein
MTADAPPPAGSAPPATLPRATPAGTAPATSPPMDSLSADGPPMAAGALARVDELAAAGVLASLDRHLARAVFALEGADELVALGAALASRAVQLGHVCVDLSRFDFDALGPPGVLTPGVWPSVEQLLRAL